jgi:hypothetical protein
LKMPAFVCDICRDHIPPPVAGVHTLPSDPSGVGVSVSSLAFEPPLRLATLPLIDADTHICKRCIIDIAAIAKNLYGKEKK